MEKKQGTQIFAMLLSNALIWRRLGQTTSLKGELLITCNSTIMQDKIKFIYNSLLSKRSFASKTGGLQYEFMLVGFPYVQHFNIHPYLQ